MSKKIIIMGLGKVGQAVVHQLLENQLPLDFTGLADSTGCLVGDPISRTQLESILRIKESGGSIKEFTEVQPHSMMSEYYNDETIIVDTSAARDLDWNQALQKGCSLVFANKNAHSASWSQAANLFKQANIRYESTVGAGLPVIATLRSQVASGDRIHRIEGVMSGTLGYLCSQLEAGATYSQAVQQAFDVGYTEPDPRDDLSGFDVLRKALILARTAGWSMEQNDLLVEPLFDDRLTGISVTEFFQRTSLLNDTYAQQIESAATEGRVLRYLATITSQGGKIGLQAVDSKSALGALQGPGNYFAFYTERYDPIPLVIAGPGAGITVTANGVLNDIIALLN